MANPEDKLFSHEVPRITILSDHPAQDRPQARDFGDVEHIADRDLLTLQSRLSPVFDILRHKNTRCPLTIAIYGTWGTGKTSAMRWMETRLGEWNKIGKDKRENHPRVHPIWFDPWRYHSREEVWRGIIAEVILALFSVERADKQDILPRLVLAAKKFGSFLGKGFLHALAGVEVKVKGGIPGVKEGELSFKGEAARSIWEEFDRTNHPEKAHLNQFEDTLRTWVRDFMPKNADGTDTERIVIFIDDLDRCLPEVTLEVLEALKLYLSIDSLIFVVGLDRGVVDAVVGNHYKENGIPVEKARSYLDKLFQVDLVIPPSEKQMGKFMDEQILALDRATKAGDAVAGYWSETLAASGFQERIESALRDLARNNPREVKRLLNSALLRGRNAALDHTLDHAGTTAKERARRFAQGIQILLLQRVVRERLANAEHLLISTPNIQWFKDASVKVVKLLDDRDKPFKDEDTLCKALAENRQSLAAGRQDAPESGAATSGGAAAPHPLFVDFCRHLNTGAPTDDSGKAIDATFWETPLLWRILRIPFSRQVAQSAPTLRAAAPAKGNLDAMLAECRPDMRQRLAGEAGVPVDALSATHLRELVKLNLNEVQINNVGLKLLGALTQLQQLYLRDTEIKDLTALAGLTKLRELDLRGTLVVDLTPLVDLTQLKELDLNRTEVSDVKPLVGLTQLLGLDLGATRVSDVTALAGLAHLQWIDLNGTRVVNVAALAGLMRLEKVYLHHTGVSDLKALAGLKNLRELEIRETAVSDEEVTALKKALPNLKIFR